MITFLYERCPHIFEHNGDSVSYTTDDYRSVSENEPPLPPKEEPQHSLKVDIAVGLLDMVNKKLVRKHSDSLQHHHRHSSSHLQANPSSNVVARSTSNLDLGHLKPNQSSSAKSSGYSSGAHSVINHHKDQLVDHIQSFRSESKLNKINLKKFSKKLDLG